MALFQQLPAIVATIVQVQLINYFYLVILIYHVIKNKLCQLIGFELNNINQLECVTEYCNREAENFLSKRTGVQMSLC